MSIAGVEEDNIAISLILVYIVISILIVNRHSEETEYWHLYRYEPIFTIRIIWKYNIINLYCF